MSELLNKEIEAPAQNITREEDKISITLKIKENNFTLELEDNETAVAFMKMLPMSIIMSELNGKEKYFYLGEPLPTNSSIPDRIETGDVMLFGNSCPVLFYESFSTSYSYTPIGHIMNVEQLKDAIGSGSVSVEWKIK